MQSKLFSFGFLCVAVMVLPHVVLGFSLEPTGMAKPIADLRDYNGTYFGSPGTGTRGYGGTLYRDNQDNGATSGCRGEGCGRHPGVDIPVPSGTSVHAALGGTVVISRCTDSWGGLVVIRAISPWNPNEPVYFTYAHLRARRFQDGRPVQAGDRVATGMMIGESGGNPNTDLCAGRTTGAHVHFQIDREDGNPEPWFPTAPMLNQRDDDFLVGSKTYNPMLFLTGGYRWSFAQTGNRELWDLFNFQSWAVTDGALWADSGNDPYIARGGLTNCGARAPCSSNIAAEANLYKTVYLDMYNQCFSNPGKIYFTTAGDSTWSEDKTIMYFPSSGGLFRDHVWMGGHPKWQGIVTGLRIDPAQNCNPHAVDPTYFGEITIER